jgi:hypothetical protein
MASAADEYKIVENPDTSVLLRYHLQVTNRVDREQEIKQHEKALANLKQPPIQPVHQHAPISHAAQQTPENENNIRAAQRHEAARVAITADDKQQQFRPLTEDEQEDARKAMQKQIAAASERKAGAESSPASVGNGAGSPAAPAAPARAATSAIPEWPPKG